MGTPREDALEICKSALQATRVDLAMEQQVRFQGGVMEVGGRRYVLKEYKRCLVIAIGKAAGAMSAALLRLAGREAQRFDGLVISPNDEVPHSGRFQYMRGGHPLPDAGSIEAAKEILNMLVPMTENDLVIFLISGGGSALVERYLESDIKLETIVEVHKALIGSGAPITAMNVVRKHLSAVKGGRLAAAAAPAEQLSIFISDVPEGELDSLSSGPTVPDRSTVQDVLQIVRDYRLVERLPEQIVNIILSGNLPETPKQGERIFARSRWTVLLSSSSLEHFAEAQAKSLGWSAHVDNTCDDWSAERAAEYLVNRVRELRRIYGPVCLISAGEVTIELPQEGGGIGGRNQHFALLCSERIAGDSITVLSCGSDGVDGNSPAAGALVDGRTMARASAAGYPVPRALEAFDSYSLLTLLGDVIKTGPTGNNLRDLRILLAQ